MGATAAPGIFTETGAAFGPAFLPLGDGSAGEPRPTANPANGAAFLPLGDGAPAAIG